MARVAVVTTGGTIASRVDEEKGGPAPALGGAELLARVPDLDRVAAVELVDHCRLPADYFGPGEWSALAARVTEVLRRPDVDGAVVTHGTDIMEETAYFLDLTVPPGRPVVVTGAQRNASEPDTDGPRNLRDAIRVAADPAASGIGTVIVFNGEIHAAREATKVETQALDAFASGRFGALGTVDPDRVVFRRQPLRRRRFDPARLEPRVEIVAVYGGCDGRLVRAAAEHGAAGIVVVANGMGNVNEPVYEAIADAIAGGVVICIATRVPRGRVLPHYAFRGGGKSLAALGAVFAEDLSPYKARILLMFALAETRDPERVQAIFRDA